MANEFKNTDIEQGILKDLIDRAFEEDIKTGDVTTDSIVDANAEVEAVWTTKDEGIIAGLNFAEYIFKRLDPDLEWKALVEDGAPVGKGIELVTFSGKGRAILTAERTALNIVQRLSGIATQTKCYTDEISDFNTQILDTRKTIPGFRLLDKYAVTMGGGMNHRMGLFDMALIKDNHIEAAGSIAGAVRKVRQKWPHIEIEVETTSLQQVYEALSAKADIIMLDNMNLDSMRIAVRQVENRAKTEASGNIELSNVRDIAATGVDYISVGALTHSVKAFDISQSLI